MKCWHSNKNIDNMIILIACPILLNTHHAINTMNTGNIPAIRQGEM